MRRTNLAFALALALPLLNAPRVVGDETGSAMAEAANRFLASLGQAEKAKAAFPFDSPERFNWHWIPRERNGLPIKALTPEQRPLAFGLLNTGLSTKGAIRATTIMSLEEILKVDEHGTGPVRDAELYFVSVFGTPSDTGEWGWRIEGHHLALNFTLKDGKVIGSTPFMFGSNPAEVKKGPRKGLRNLIDIETPANALIASLTPDQRKLAIVADTAPEVTTTPNPAQAPASAPEGIAIDKLEPGQRENLVKLVRVYAVSFPASVRDRLLGEIAKGENDAHFAWYGPTDITKPHAFHIQASTFYIDFNDTQNETNHIHTFYRSLVGDFGIPAR